MNESNRRDILSKLGAGAAALVAVSIAGRALALEPVRAPTPKFNKARSIKFTLANPCGTGDVTVVTEGTKDGLVVKSVSKGRPTAVGFNGPEHVLHLNFASDVVTLTGLDDILNRGLAPAGSGGSTPPSSGGGTGEY